MSQIHFRDMNAAYVPVLTHHIVVLCKHHAMSYLNLLALFAGKTYSRKKKITAFEALIIVSV